MFKLLVYDPSLYGGYISLTMIPTAAPNFYSWYSLLASQEMETGRAAWSCFGGPSYFDLHGIVGHSHFGIY